MRRGFYWRKRMKCGREKREILKIRDVKIYIGQHGNQVKANWELFLL